MEQQQQTQDSQWAIVEIFGRKVLAGRVTKDTSLFPMLRIDVPATSEWPEYTVEHGPAAIFSIVYVNEAVARATAESLKVNPISVYNPELVTREKFEKTVDQYKQRLAELRALPARTSGSPSGDENDEFTQRDDESENWEG
jgi:hypothetical protein